MVLWRKISVLLCLLNALVGALLAHDTQRFLAADLLRQHVRNTSPAVLENAYKNAIAQVRYGAHLCDQEHAFLKKRLAHVKKTIERTLNRSLDGKKIPKIALAISGGGYRAMVATIGTLIGLEKTGLLDTLTYILGLSGSTWAIAPWLTSGHSLTELREDIKRKIALKPTDISSREFHAIIDALLVKFAFHQPLSFVDLYGALLANRLYNDKQDKIHRIYLSDQARIIADGAYPFPIYTAVCAQEDASYNSWYEFTPYEIGALEFNAFVPSWAYGRTFLKGTSIDYAPEQSIGFHLGTFGSGFAARIDEIYAAFMKRFPTDMNELWQSMCQHIAEYVGSQRLLPAAFVNNFMYGDDRSPQAACKVLEIVDAGSAPGFNLPYPPMSGERPDRHADVIIFLDYSQKINGAEQLRAAQEYAQRKGLLFPPINYEGIEKRMVSVFADEHNPNCPVVIYMPRIHDQSLWERFKNDPAFVEYAVIDHFDIEDAIENGFAKTLSVHYTPKEVELLSRLAEFNMIMTAPILWNVLDALIGN